MVVILSLMKQGVGGREEMSLEPGFLSDNDYSLGGK